MSFGGNDETRDEALMSPRLPTPPPDRSVETWYTDQSKINPKKKCSYILLVMTSVDPAFDYTTTPPFSVVHNSKKKMKGWGKTAFVPTKALCVIELTRRGKKKGVNYQNKTLDDLVEMIRDDPIVDPADVEFVKRQKNFFSEELQRVLESMCLDR